MPIRKQIERRLEIGMGTIEGPLLKVMAELRDYLEAHGPSARLEVDYGYDTSDQLYLVFLSEETEAEYDERMAAKQRRKQEKAKRLADVTQSFRRFRSEEEP